MTSPENVQVGYGGTAAMLEEIELAQCADEIGSTLMEMVTMRFMTEATPADASRFTAWVDAHVGEGNFVTLLVAEFPLFATLLSEEVEAMTKVAEATVVASE